jgi:hypothetical protein
MARDTQFLLRSHDGKRTLEFPTIDDARDFMRGKPTKQWDVFRKLGSIHAETPIGVENGKGE